MIRCPIQQCLLWRLFTFFEVMKLVWKRVWKRATMASHLTLMGWRPDLSWSLINMGDGTDSFELCSELRRPPKGTNPLPVVDSALFALPALHTDDESP